MSDSVLPLSIPADHPAYAGHFPGRPILPGVVLLDAVLHALAVQHRIQVECGQFKSAKFHRPVQPGEALILHYTQASNGGFHFEIRCMDKHGGECSVASGVLVFSPVAQA